jgi:hypothetical protein
MENLSDVLVGIDGQSLVIDFGLPSALFDPHGDLTLDENDIDGRSFLEVASNLVKPIPRCLSSSTLAVTSIHRHFLDPLALDFRPFPHYYFDYDFMSVVRSICLSVSKIRLAGFTVLSREANSAQVVVVDYDQVLIHSFLVDGLSCGSIASMVLRADSLAAGLSSACASVSD